jgi:hypothetical protein
MASLKRLLGMGVGVGLGLFALMPGTASASNKASVVIDHVDTSAPQLPFPATYYGHVIADKRKCGKGRKITLFERTGSGKVKFPNTDTSEETEPGVYAWDINATAADGHTYFAKMKKKRNCKKATSEDFDFPDDNSRSARAAKAKTKVTISGWDSSPPPGMWRGRLTSDKAKCRKLRYIELFMHVDKENFGMGNTTAEKDGKKWVWEVPTPLGAPEDGDYFVTVTPTEDCARDESKIFSYPYDNARR